LSTAAQKCDEAHEIEVRPFSVSVSTVCHEFTAVDASTLPSLSTAEHVTAVTQDTELIVAVSFP
jgi:hypothetical protein